MEDLESARPALHGVVVREACRHPSNFRSEGDINQFLLRYGVIGIEGIDTRSLTRRLRTRGTMNGVICSGERLDIDAAATSELVQLARECPHADKVNFVRDVTTREPYHIDGYGYRVTVIDYGVRRSLLKSLGQRGCSITVMPATSTVEQIIETEPDGIVLSNGPGDPRNVDYATPPYGSLDTVRCSASVSGTRYSAERWVLRFSSSGMVTGAETTLSRSCRPEGSASLRRTTAMSLTETLLTTAWLR